MASVPLINDIEFIFYVLKLANQKELEISEAIGKHNFIQKRNNLKPLLYDFKSFLGHKDRLLTRFSISDVWIEIFMSHFSFT